MKKITKAEAIEKLENGFGSIYTKEEVIGLITQIEDEKKETDIDLVSLTEFIADNLTHDKDFIDKETADFSLNGQTIELEDVDFREQELERIVEQGIREYIETEKEKKENLKAEAEAMTEQNLED